MEGVENRSMEGWLAGGVPFHIPGNGGPDCVQFISLSQRLLETFIFSLISVVMLIWSIRSLPPLKIKEVHKLDRYIKNILSQIISII